jgi:hypothetical protein
MSMQPIRISGSGVHSIDAAFLAMGYVGSGPADGPYPGMYEHWPNWQLEDSFALPERQEQFAQ